jgi:hypothetical protein
MSVVIRFVSAEGAPFSVSVISLFSVSVTVVVEHSCCLLIVIEKLSLAGIIRDSSALPQYLTNAMLIGLWHVTLANI